MGRLNDKDLENLWNDYDDAALLDVDVEETIVETKKPKRTQSEGGKISSKEDKINRDLMKHQEEVEFFSSDRTKGRKPRGNSLN